MNYFVSIENTSYDLWQTELLIQSFKYLGLEKNLYIAIADCKKPANPEFSHNIKNHENKFMFEDIGGIKNRFFSLATLVAEGKMSLPVTTIHPDMVLIKPMTEYKSDFVFSLFDQDQDYKNEFKEYLQPDNLLIMRPSAVYFINKNVPLAFFETLCKFSTMLCKYETNWIEKAIWYCSIINYSQNNLISIAHDNIEQSMLNFNLFANFIHYNHGKPPDFHKNYFRYDGPVCLLLHDSNPLKAICSVNSNESTEHIVKIVESYWNEYKIN